MEIDTKRYLLVISALVTTVLLLGILLFGNVLNNERKDYVDENIQDIQDQLRELQTFDLLGDSFGDEMACIVAQRSLEELDESLWDLGTRLERYAEVSRQVYDDPYYREQKRVFNDQQIRYMAMIQQVEKNCDIDKTVVAFFYRNESACEKCNDQSFVLGDVNERYGDELSMFAYDLDLNSTLVDVLAEYYEVDATPCVVIEDEAECRMQSTEVIVNRICEADPERSLCSSQS